MTANRAGLTDDLYYANILKNVEADFYSLHFKNTDAENYDVFLEEKSEEIRSLKNSENFQEQDRKLQTLLPVYTSDTSLSDATLSEFHFVNYIENLLYSFNIEVEGDI